MAHVNCPNCESPETKKHGKDRNEAQRYLCKECRRTFVPNPAEKPLGEMHLPIEKARLIIHLLVEGTSVSATARIADVHKETVLKVLVKVGQKCQRILDREIQGVRPNHIQADEIWTFIRKKQRRVKWDDPKSWGDAYCFISLDAETKLAINHTIGKRDGRTAALFIQDLCERLADDCKPQLTTDGFQPYVSAVEDAFGGNIDYGMLVKQFQGEVETGRERYSPGGLQAVTKSIVQGSPDPDLISTSFVERQNRTVRMAVRRFTRLVDAFSKKLENLKAACSLHFAFYNFCRPHLSLGGCTPAQEAGLTSRIWEIEDLIRAA